MIERTHASTNPRSVVGASGPEPLFAWVAWDGGEEQLLVWLPSLPEPVEVVRAQALGRPAACQFRGRAYVACAVDRGMGFEQRIHLLEGSQVVSARSLSSPNSYPGEIALCQGAADGVTACWEELTDEGVKIVSSRVDSNLAAEDVTVVTPLGGAHLSPRLAWDGRRAWLGWLEGRRRGGPWTARVIDLARPNSHGYRVGRSRHGIGGLALDASPSGRLWLAWHTDRRPGREPDLTRWVEVVCLDSGQILVPRGSAPRAEWGKLGEDQGLEFPMLAARDDGTVTLLARSSHRWWRLELGADGWALPEALDDEGWGCRSRSIAFLPLAEGGLLWARRQRAGVAISEIERKGSSKVPRTRSRADHSLPAPAPTTTPAPRYLRPRHRRMGEYLLCFGDIHQHTAHSDGTGTTRESYERARDRYGDDFVSVTDHEDFLGKRIGPGEWRGQMALCDLFDEPGRFVTLPGYEWTGRRHPGPGHRCVYLPDTSYPLLGRAHRAAETSAELIQALKRCGGLVFPHHVGWTGADAEAHDPAVQTCWEIVSVHGAYEALGVGPIGQRDVPLEGHFIRDQLDRGLRFGFVGGTDGHGLLWHHGIAHRRDSHRTGLTAVFVEQLSREAVLDALRKRRCYATSGVKMVLDLRVDGKPMGSDVAVSDAVEAQILIDAPSSLARADLIFSHGRSEPLNFSGSRAAATVRVPLGPSPIDYVYLRAEQRDGDIGWTSPLWLTRES